jgi:hypothetical protein
MEEAGRFQLEQLCLADLIGGKGGIIAQCYRCWTYDVSAAVIS